MKCPACNHLLTQMQVGGITVDACEGGCGGIWFDWFELDKVNEKHETPGEELLDIDRDARVEVDQDKRRLCPTCDTVMMRHCFSVARKVQIDECPECGGIWLDHGELAAIRELFETSEGREEAAEEYFDKMFGKELERIRAESETERRRTAKIAHVLRFLCPSYYIKGKQDWGAF